MKITAKVNISYLPNGSHPIGQEMIEFVDLQNEYEVPEVVDVDWAARIFQHLCGILMAQGFMLERGLTNEPQPEGIVIFRGLNFVPGSQIVGIHLHELELRHAEP